MRSGSAFASHVERTSLKSCSARRCAQPTSISSSRANTSASGSAQASANNPNADSDRSPAANTSATTGIRLRRSPRCNARLHAPIGSPVAADNHADGDRNPRPTHTPASAAAHNSAQLDRPARRRARVNSANTSPDQPANDDLTTPSMTKGCDSDPGAGGRQAATIKDS